MTTKAIFLCLLIASGCPLLFAAEICSDKTTMGVFIDTAKNIQQCADKENCTDLKPGESSWVLFADGKKSPTSIAHIYKLRRVSEKEFEVAVPIALEHAGAKDLANPEAALEIQEKIVRYYDRLDQCMNEANKYFKGPGGQSLKIKIERPSVAYKTVQKSPDKKNSYHMTSEWGSEKIVKINLHQDHDFRTNSKNHSETLNCETQIHEILHLVGLCDEYQEVTRGYIRDPVTGKLNIAGANTKNVQRIKEYNCRIRSVDKSVMNDHSTAFKSAKGVWMGEMHRCFYPATNKAKCADLQSRWNGDSKTCPQNGRSVYSLKEIKNNNNESIAAKKYKDIDATGGECWISSYENRFEQAPSLLYPAHFYSITRPGCENYNKVYYACAKRAYLTDTKNKNDVENSCDIEQIPNECKNQSDSWLKQVGEVD